MKKTKHTLLPTGSEERVVLGVGSIPVAKLPSCQNMKILKYCITIKLHEYSWVVKIGLGQYDGLGEYCDPSTAPSLRCFLYYYHERKSDSRPTPSALQ